MPVDQDVFSRTAETADSAFATDTVSLSTASVISGPSRSEKLASLREKINNGSYQVSSSEVADAMLRKGFFNPQVQ